MFALKSLFPRLLFHPLRQIARIARRRHNADVPGQLAALIHAGAHALRQLFEHNFGLVINASFPRHLFVRHYAHWDTRPVSVYLPERFKVEVGDLTRHSRVLEGNEENVNLKRVVEVP